MNIMKVKYLLYITTILISLSGCKVGKRYVQAKLNLPESFRGDTLTYQPDTITFPQVSWRDFFNDPQLIKQIETAVVNNYDIRTALRSIVMAKQNIRKKKLENLQSIDGNIATVNKQYRSREFYNKPSSSGYSKNGREAPVNFSPYQS